MRCKICNAYVPEGATHCLDCGSQFEDIIVCQTCAAELSSKAKFCNRCGTPARKPDAYKNPEFTIQEKSSTESGPIECYRCGGNVPKGTIYCPTCGINVSKIDEPAQPAVVTVVESDPTEKSVTVPACPRCGAIPRGSGRFCHNCGRFHGSDIEDVICPNCGATNVLRYARCQYCGNELPSPPKIKKTE
jgi:predicted amidophosphoribosyltransferase